MIKEADTYSKVRIVIILLVQSLKSLKQRMPRCIIAATTQIKTSDKRNYFPPIIAGISIHNNCFLMMSENGSRFLVFKILTCYINGTNELLHYNNTFSDQSELAIIMDKL
jgi:hypothetical protein